VINFEDSPGGCHKPEGVNPKLKKWVNSTRKSTLDRVLEDRDPKLKARSFENQKTEAKMGTRILNWMTELGRSNFERTA
jgi:hypothetical protein